MQKRKRQQGREVKKARNALIRKLYFNNVKSYRELGREFNLAISTLHEIIHPEVYYKTRKDYVRGYPQG